MKYLCLLAAALFLLVTLRAWAHPMMGAVTWNRQISRIVYAHCVSCHRDGGTSFSLMEYAEAREAADAIKRAVLSRKMPPWGAVKGFGELRDEQGLSEAQIEMIVDWVDTGTGRGNNPRVLPARPAPPMDVPTFAPPRNAVAVSGETVLDRKFTLTGVFPDKVPPGGSLQIVAALPNGDIEPLVWLYEYQQQFGHAFWLEDPLSLPAGTAIRGVPKDARILLIPRGR
jgi:mono/diheme cytochrome c family protein